MSGKLLPAGPSALTPKHPGELLREDVLPALGLTVTDAAKALKITRQTLHAILAERSGVTPEMAARLGKLCGNGPGLWLRLQVDHDLHRVQRDMAGMLEDSPTMKTAA